MQTVEQMPVDVQEVTPAYVSEITESNGLSGGEQTDKEPGLTVQVRLSGEQTWGKLAMMEAEAAPGVGQAPHVHPDEDMVFHVTSGHFWVKIGEEIQTVQQGDTLYIPHGIVHAWRQIGTEPGRYIKVLTPAGERDFSKEMNPLLKAGAMPTKSPLIM
jgi:quercetin dioxygenase-like cupin family protein